MAEEENKKTFSDYFAEGMESLTQTAFPQLSKFMDFSRTKEKEENASADKVSDQEEADRPSRRRNASYNTVANEMVLDALGAIDERLKIQSIVLISSLEQQTLTNQLLTRITSGGGSSVGGNNGNGSNGGGSVIDDVLGALGGFSIGNYIKSIGKSLLSGSSAVAGVAGAAAGSLIYGDISGNEQMKKDHPDLYPNDKPIGDEEKKQILGDLKDQQDQQENKKKMSDIDNNIKIYQDDLARLQHYLKLNNDSEENRKKILEQEAYLQKQIADLQNQKVEALKKEKELEKTSDKSDILGYSITENKPDSSVEVKSPDNAPVPIVSGDYAHFGVPIQGNGVDFAKSHVGMSIGGNAPNVLHPGGVGGYRATGDVSQRTKEAWHYFKSKGYTDEQVSAIMGNIQQESTFNPGAYNPKDPEGSLGIAQWNRERRAQMEQFVSGEYNKPYDQLSHEEQYTGQLHFINEEISRNYNGSLTALRSGNFAKFSHRYEGYGDNSEGTRLANGQRFLELGRAGKFDDTNPNQQGNITTPKNAKEVTDHLIDMRNKGLITNEQCVSLATAAVGIRLGDNQLGSNVHDWRKGDNALEGGLKPGTPIATFLDRQGRQSERYAGGGSGTPRAHLDHAAVFQGYTYDKDGHINGMNVSEQYKDSGGMHTRHYGIGGFGEADARNYYAIKTADNKYLGGERNPMQHQQDVVSHWSDIAEGEKYRDFTKAQTLADKEYEHEKHAPAIRDIGIQAHANDILISKENSKKISDSHKETISDVLQKKSNEDAVNDKIESKRPTILQQQVAQKTDGTNQLTHKEKSGRISNKEVGSANPPSSRLKELFTTNVNQKDF